MIARTFGKLGILALLVMLIANSVAPVSAATTPYSSDFVAQTGGASATMGSGGAQVYGGPGLGFWRLGRLRAGATVPLLARNGDASFWLVRAPFGEGWISNNSVASANTEGVPVLEIGAFAAVTAGNAAVRTAPGVDAPRLGVLSRGGQFYVLGQSGDGGWLEIQTGFGKGWIATSVTTLAGTITPLPGADQPTATVNASFLNVRTGPANYFTTVAVASKSDTFPILGKTRDGFWLYVETGSGKGWVNVRFVKTTNFFGSTPIITRETYLEAAVVAGTTRTSVNLRAGPSLEFDSLAVISGAGTEVALLGQSPDKAWWYVRSSVGEGWVNKGVIQTLGGTELIPVLQ